MTADAERETALTHCAVHQRAQVGDKAVVSGHQLVKLSAARSVLVFKAVRFAALHGAERAGYDLFINRRKLVARAGEEARDPGIAVRDGGCLRGAQG